jgi:hypothetical protein
MSGCPGFRVRTRRHLINGISNAAITPPFLRTQALGRNPATDIGYPINRAINYRIVDWNGDGGMDPTLQPDDGNIGMRAV